MKKRKKIKPLHKLSFIQLYKYRVSQGYYHDYSRSNAVQFFEPYFSQVAYLHKCDILDCIHSAFRILQFFQDSKQEFDTFVFVPAQGSVIVKTFHGFAHDYILYLLYPPKLDSCKHYRNLCKPSLFQVRLRFQAYTAIGMGTFQFWTRYQNMSKDKYMNRFLIKHLPKLNQDIIKHILSFLPGYYGRFIDCCLCSRKKNKNKKSIT